jgi:RNA polymerase sigma-70 factor (ECF subfamily)
MVGSRTEAEDLVQEALLRVHLAQQREVIENADAYTTTVLTRLAIDHLRSARVRRESYVGPWLPEPVDNDPAADAARMAELSDSLSLAFLVVLESLGPVERAALLLHDVFGYGYGELAAMLGRSEAACRQLASRARQRVAERRPRFDVDPAHHAALVERFLDACRAGAVDGIVSLLAEDALLVTDGGADVRAARFPIRGSERTAKVLAKVMPRRLGRGEVRITTVNGLPGFVLLGRDGRPASAGSLDIVDGRIQAVYWVVNPDKLDWLAGSEA